MHLPNLSQIYLTRCHTYFCADPKGDYCIGLKANQGNFFDSVVMQLGGMSKSVLDRMYGPALEVIEKGHGRIEERRYWLCKDIEKFVEPTDWKGLSAIGIAERQIYKNGVESIERRFFIVSFADNVERFRNASGVWEP